MYNLRRRGQNEPVPVPQVARGSNNDVVVRRRPPVPPQVAPDLPGLRPQVARGDNNDVIARGGPHEPPQVAPDLPGLPNTGDRVAREVHDHLNPADNEAPRPALAARDNQDAPNHPPLVRDDQPPRPPIVVIEDRDQLRPRPSQVAQVQDRRRASIDSNQCEDSRVEGSNPPRSEAARTSLPPGPPRPLPTMALNGLPGLPAYYGQQYQAVAAPNSQPYIPYGSLQYHPWLAQPQVTNTPHGPVFTALPPHPPSVGPCEGYGLPYNFNPQPSMNPPNSSFYNSIPMSAPPLSLYNSAAAPTQKLSSQPTTSVENPSIGLTGTTQRADMLKKIKLEPYNGENDVNPWLGKVRTLMILNDICDSESQKAYVHLHMAGKALSWINDRGIEAYETYDQLEKGLKQTFGVSEGRKQRCRTELLNLQQGNLSIQEISEKFETTWRIAYQGDVGMHNQYKIHAYLRTLNPSIASAVGVSNPVTYESAKDTALRVEAYAPRPAMRLNALSGTTPADSDAHLDEGKSPSQAVLTAVQHLHQSQEALSKQLAKDLGKQQDKNVEEFKSIRNTLDQLSNRGQREMRYHPYQPKRENPNSKLTGSNNEPLSQSRKRVDFSKFTCEACGGTGHHKGYAGCPKHPDHNPRKGQSLN